VDAPLDPRVVLANERTLLSWMRCALALIAVGTTAGTIVKIEPVWLHAAIAVVPILLGLAAALLGLSRWQRMDDAIRLGAEPPPDRELRLVALSIAVIAVIAGAVAVASIFT
jgi:putative membrane protein